MSLTFDSVLLSAAKTGNPPLSDTSLTSLSADGVNIISLSANDVGIAYNAKDTLVGTLVTANIQGSVIKIDRAYNATDMALVKTDGSHTSFQFLSATPTQTGFTEVDLDVTTPNTRRLWVYGYR